MFNPEDDQLVGNALLFFRNSLNIPSVSHKFAIFYIEFCVFWWHLYCSCGLSLAFPIDLVLFYFTCREHSITLNPSPLLCGECVVRHLRSGILAGPSQRVASWCWISGPILIVLQNLVVLISFQAWQCVFQLLEVCYISLVPGLQLVKKMTLQRADKNAAEI